MEQIPDAPDIARALRTGYPVEPHFPPECPRCGDRPHGSNPCTFTPAPKEWERGQ